jgi:MFS family permease
MTVGSILATLLMVAWAQVNSLLAFYLIMAGIGLASAGVLYEPAFAIVAVWFRQQRGRALAVLTFFGALASFVFIPLSAFLVEALGWRNALLTLAAILGMITIPLHGLLLRRRPEDLGLLPDGATIVPAQVGQFVAQEPSMTTSAALREPRFWLLTFAFAVSTTAGVTMTVHMIPYLIERGHSATFAATIAGLFGLMSLLGRITIGPLADRIARRWVTMALMILQMLGLLALITVGDSSWGALCYIALFGAGAGTLTIMRAALLAEYYGPTSYGTINGAQSMALTSARTIAPLGAGLLASALGGYPPLFIGLAFLLLVATVAVCYSGASH